MQRFRFYSPVPTEVMQRFRFNSRSRRAGETVAICKNGPREIPVTVNNAFSALANPTIE